MKNRNSVYATAYARKILGLTQKDVSHLKRIKKSNAQAKPINKHGNYDGTDVGFTSKSIGNPVKCHTQLYLIKCGVLSSPSCQL